MFNIEDSFKKLPEAVFSKSRVVDMSKNSWFGVGGRCIVCKAYNLEDLLNIVNYCREDQIQRYVIGALSNTLISDDGFDGILIKLAGDFVKYKIISEELIYLGAAILDSSITNILTENSLGGLEFLSVIPGSVGGNIAMNAGCYGFEIKDKIVSFDVIDSDGNLKKINDINMSYRCNNSINKNDIVIGGLFKVYNSHSEDVLKLVKELSDKKNISQPLHCKTGGSTFKNPNGYKSWELIDKVGLRGFAIGDAEVSNIHPNFLINKGSASAKNIRDLIQYIKKKVFNEYGVELFTEIVIL
jgi:UDP-N-acetylmuramate dehydrogenase